MRHVVQEDTERDGWGLKSVLEELLKPWTDRGQHHGRGSKESSGPSRGF